MSNSAKELADDKMYRFVWFMVFTDRAINENMEWTYANCFFSRGHEILTGGYEILTRVHEILRRGHEIAKSLPQDG